MLGFLCKFIFVEVVFWGFLNIYVILGVLVREIYDFVLIVGWEVIGI